MNLGWSGVREQLRDLYDAYYASRDYERRYPRANHGTLAFMWRHGAARARCVLDVGCGSGRYAMPVLAAGNARVVGCDISRAAIDAFAARLRGHRHAARVTLVHGGAEALAPQLRADCILLLFGVLSHVGPRAARVRALAELRARAADDARLLLSVPSIWRRRPMELMASLADVLRGRRERWGDIAFQRDIGGHKRTFHYHLYTVAALREELALAGWQLQAWEAESLLPEWLLTQWPALERLDLAVQPWLPAAFGYGIRAMARATPHQRPPAEGGAA
ncbi:class I SAM-dependent methyltransferase [Ramlibacter sp. AN1015]|uniref:class I SAM-dependent methyltransferase n=1 Tax=Ramlibacter sp. AN1015 TaxID=3133428 RepID=UPI0030C053D6